MDEHDLQDLLRAVPTMADSAESDGVLEELQRAVAEQERILQRQGELIRRLREELKGVHRD